MKSFNKSFTEAQKIEREHLPSKTHGTVPRHPINYPIATYYPP